MFKSLLFKNTLLNYQCPNGLPPDECKHVPQLILNAISYYQNKQQVREESADIQAKAGLERTNNSVAEMQDKQKQRRRG